ncbi:MAG: glycosyltransferase family 4 protein [Caulobacterales bacterium]|nr:glycosyltransferase family 4 protein [Caulobacterales bacterium]
MRILYSHRTKSADGQYVHIRALTEALAARGHEIIMAGPDDSGVKTPKRLDAGAGEGGLKALLPKPIYEAAEIAYSIPAYFRLAEKAAGADILYERYNLFYHSGVRLARSRRLPMILEVNAPLADERARHGGLALKPLARWSETSIWRAADAVLPVTGVLAKMIEKAGVPPEKITVIQNGVDAEFLAAVDPRETRARYGLEGKLVLGFTGFVREWHGVDRIVRYIAQSGRKDLHLLLVGDGSAREGLERQAREAGVADQLTVTGVMQRDAMPAHVAAFDIALQPAVVAYASPLKLFEYMAQARAIVAPASENIREVLTSGGDALLFALDDEAALFAALDRLVADASLREKLGKSARESLLRQGFTWAENAARVERIAARLMEERK